MSKSRVRICPIGYFKVFTTDRPTEIADEDSWPSADKSLIAQWVFPFTRALRDAARDDAMDKARDVSRRLGGAQISGIVKVREIDNAYAIRVGDRKEEPS